VAAVCQGQVSRIYVNGHLCAEKQRQMPGLFQPAGAESAAAQSRPNPRLTIGNLPHFAGRPRPFAGLMDEVRLSRRGLAPSEFLKTRDPMPEPKGPIPERYELPFTATNRSEAVAWQRRARSRLFELVSACAPRKTLLERPLDFQIASSEKRAGYTFHHASFQGNDAQRYACLWTMPDGAGPFPAVLCLHGHGGSADAVWEPRQIYDGFARRLAEGGYCTLAPSFPHRTYAAETLWDLLRGVDILASNRQVDAQRIGVMGLSMGGEWAMWAAACDERLRAAVISGWMCTTEGVFAVFNCPCWELPGFVELMDVAEVNLLVAPRPVLFESAESDPCFLLRYTREGFNRIRAGYSVFAAPEAPVQDVFPGGHKVHGAMAYPFLDKILGGKAAAGQRAPEAKP
jgi:pimeloyl-ACP methyl ester carboxylesterase